MVYWLERMSQNISVNMKKGLLERLAEGPVIGDGGMIFALEKRGYVTAGYYTLEVVLEHPEAVRQLSREFLRGGSDVLQACTFYADKTDKLDELNEAACRLAKEVAETGDALVAGGISPSAVAKGGSKEEVKAAFRKQMACYTSGKVDFLVAELIDDIVEMEYAIETMKEMGIPVAATMGIGPTGDVNDVSVAECAVRMAKAGADVVGINCRFEPKTCVENMKIMKAALDKEGLTPYLMAQPLGFHTADVNNTKYGYGLLDEMPLAMDQRTITRWEARQFARDAYEAGVRYIGGCCGFEPHHIREMAEELAEERGRRPPGSDKNPPFGAAMIYARHDFSKKKCGREYWMNLKAGTGLPPS